MSHLMTSLFPMHAAIAMAAEAKTKETKAIEQRRASAWNTDLPDSDITVLLRLDSEEYPIVTGYRDGMDWRCDGLALVTSPVLGWMHLEDACKLLDGGVQ